MNKIIFCQQSVSPDFNCPIMYTWLRRHSKTQLCGEIWHEYKLYFHLERDPKLDLILLQSTTKYNVFLFHRFAHFYNFHFHLEFCSFCPAACPNIQFRVMFRCIHVNYVVICYHSGFYSSLNDEMGLNYDNFEIYYHSQ